MAGLAIDLIIIALPIGIMKQVLAIQIMLKFVMVGLMILLLLMVGIGFLKIVGVQILVMGVLII